MRSLFNNIKPPSWLPQRTDLHLFKDGIKPAWEDPQNEKGGSWTYALPKGAPGEQLDKIWLDAVRAFFRGPGCCACCDQQQLLDICVASSRLWPAVGQNFA